LKWNQGCQEGERVIFASRKCLEVQGSASDRIREIQHCLTLFIMKVLLASKPLNMEMYRVWQADLMIPCLLLYMVNNTLLSIQGFVLGSFSESGHRPRYPGMHTWGDTNEQ